ncbi:MAG: carboxypeptidase regulatory-like domain-containing protein [Candidatus Coatesbacteria bacterium]|nr:carboxypeptidase regulatory-like domain-containing protein [Candidatus Coatesbacteria bacterium]
MTGARQIKCPTSVITGLSLFCLIVLVCALPSLGSSAVFARFFPERQNYITWDRLRLFLELEGGSGTSGSSVDIYLGVMLPGGSLFSIVPDLSFQGLNVEKGRLYPVLLDEPETFVPAVNGLTVREGMIMPRTLVYRAILSHGLSLPDGEYTALAMACVAGTLTPVSFSAESFNYVPQACTVSGQVFDENGPASSATVIIQTRPNRTLTDSNGYFHLEGVPCDSKVNVSAWKYEYYCTFVEATSPTTSVVLHLDAIMAEDNEEYEWLAPDPVDPQQNFCIKCHPLPYDQWSHEYHSRSASNVIFQTLYSGTDIRGNPDVGPGYRLDFPNTAGSCALCHAPSAALESPYDTDMSGLTGLGQRGVFCDLCHKIIDVDVSNLMHVYGINAIEFRRPFPERQLFLGTMEDVNGHADSHLPLMKRSEFCAPCHSCQFWGVPVYTSFPEWEASEYKEMGIQCQACHYRPDAVTTNYAPPPGHGLLRDTDDIPSHLTMGADNVGLHYVSATLSITASRESDDRLVATVEVFNAFAGHHLPTDRDIRNITLLVTAFDSEGSELESIGGEVVPIYGGTGGGPRDFAGRPGKMFAKILVDMRGNHPAPSWRQTTVLSDTRIPALTSDFSTYEFRLPAGANSATVEARLIYRRAFKDLADQKGFLLDDILMTSEVETFHFAGS